MPDEQRAALEAQTDRLNQQLDRLTAEIDFLLTPGEQYAIRQVIGTMKTELATLWYALRPAKEPTRV